jgi:hypothetical protein
LYFNGGSASDQPVKTARTLSISVVCLITNLTAVSAPQDGPTSGAAKESSAANTSTEKPAGTKRTVSPELRAALAKLELPGVRINLDEWSVDVDSRVCLRDGLLELIACTKDSKEHESIIVVDAKPSHIHAALLLLGAKAGNPAMQQPIDSEMTRFIHKPPTGAAVDVSLVLTDAQGKATVHPISDFISPADHGGAETGSATPDDQERKKEFPTSTFLFAGSILVGEGEGPKRYLCDLNGNVISITTFGDELLCLPGVHDHSNGSLMWQVNGEKLPELDTKVTLRLRPQ